jgi:hypothetical protein
MELIDVTLSNGTVIEDVPADTSQAVLQDLAIAGGYATIEDFKTEPEPSPVEPAAPEPSWLDKNMDVPLGVGGGILGTVIGTPLGPAGMWAGGTLGGAVGTFAGSLISDDLSGEDLEYAKALEEAAISMGFDTALPVLGKAIKPAWVVARKKMGFTPREAAEQLVQELGGDAGTTASIRASQQILEEGGATLTPSQVGAEGVALLKERIGRLGLLSGRQFDTNAAKVNEVVSESLSEVVNKLSVNSSGSANEIAQELMTVVEQGKQALYKNYGESLDQLASQVGGKIDLPIGKHIYVANNYIARNTHPGEIVDLDPATVDFIHKNLGSLIGDNLATKTNLPGLVALDKQITRQIDSSFGAPVGSPNHNANAHRELTALAKELREATYKALKTVDPDAAKKYKAMKDAYAEGIDGLSPRINSNFVAQADKGNYNALGQLLTKGGNIDQVIAFKKSLRDAFKEIDSAEMAGRFISFDEADALIKKGFLEQTFPLLGKPQFDIANYSNLAKQLSDPTTAAKYKAILGSDYPQVKQLINLMAEASVKPGSNLGELAFRSKEYGAARDMWGGLQGVAAGASGSFLGGAAILGTPYVLAKASLNPANVKKLIDFQNTKFKTSDLMYAAGQRILSDILDEMTEEEQAALRNNIRDVNLVRQQETADVAMGIPD